MFSVTNALLKFVRNTNFYFSRLLTARTYTQRVVIRHSWKCYSLRRTMPFSKSEERETKNTNYAAFFFLKQKRRITTRGDGGGPTFLKLYEVLAEASVLFLFLRCGGMKSYFWFLEYVWECGLKCERWGNSPQVNQLGLFICVSMHAQRSDERRGSCRRLCELWTCEHRPRPYFHWSVIINPFRIRE